MVLNKYTGSTLMDGSENNLFKIVGSTMKHFASYVYLKALQAGESIRLRVYNKVDGVSQWKLDGDVTDSVASNNGTITNIPSWLSQWKFDGNVNDSIGTNNGTITYHANLKRLYKFENNVNDSTTSAANGTVTGTTTYVQGKEGQAFSFDGSSYILASDTGLSAINTAWSVSGWINPTSFVAQRSIYAWGSNVANQGINIYANTSGKIVIDNVTGVLLTSIGTIQSSIATFITVTYDGTTLRLYINGIQDSTATPAALNITLAGATGQHVGTYISNTNNFLGWIDELRNYNIALTQAQVSALYMNGKFAQSHTFDGGEYITFGTSSTFNFERTNSFSISFWVKSTVSQSFVGFVGKTDASVIGWSVGQNGTAVEVLLINVNNVNQIKVHAGNIADGNWHHVVVTYAGTSLASGISIYIDGVVATVVVDNDTLSASILNAVVPNIGALTFNGADPFIGQLDEIRVYNAVLTLSQVLGLYNYTGSNYITPLPIGNALSLDGSSYMNIGRGNPYNWERTQAFSTSFWAKFTDNNVKGIMGNSNAGQGWSVDTNTGSVELMLRNTANTNELRVRTTNTYNDGNWHNYVITYSGNSLPSGVNIYVDGVAVGMTTVTNNLSATTVGGNFGVGSFGSGTLPYIGLVDEVQIWNYVLSSAEINAINAGRFANTHPIGLWHFDGDLYDYSGQGSTGNPTGTMTYVTGALSGSYNVPNTHFNFDGSEYITAGNPTNLQFERTNPLSFAFWVRTISTAGNNTIINKFNETSGYVLYMDGSGNINFLEATSLNINDFVSSGSGRSVNDGLWHHVVVTYDGANNANGVKFYIDGVLETTNVQRNNLSGSILNSSNVTFGVYTTINTATFFIGEIDDLRVYNRALSSAEVSDLFTYPDSEMKQLIYDKQYTGVVSDAKYVPMLQGNQYMVTAQQLSGTNRLISWEREEVS